LIVERLLLVDLSWLIEKPSTIHDQRINDQLLDTNAAALYCSPSNRLTGIPEQEIRYDAP
jgi:hypothetical protein